MKTIVLIFFGLMLSVESSAQIGRDTDLFRVMKQYDSLLFELGFNRCDIATLEKIVSEDLEFYHDQSGITPNKEAFITSIRDGICKLNYKPKRVLDTASLQVHALKKNGVLYGAIQAGKHSFYAIEPGKPEYLTSTAWFTHLWLLEEGQWKLKRVLSYDHQAAK
jgi:hypothetical protein